MVFLRAFLGFLFLLAFPACDRGGDAAHELSLTLAQAPLLPGAAALTSARDDLIGGGAGPLGPGAGLVGPGGLTGTAYRQTRAEGAALHLTQRHVLRRRGESSLALVGVLGLGASAQAWHLPQGVGVLVDPMDIRVASQTLTAELRLQHQRPITLPALGPLHLESHAGVGVVQARSQTRLDSALLAYRHSSTTAQPYLTAGVALRGARQGPVTPALGLRLTASRLAGVEAGLNLELRH